MIQILVLIIGIIGVNSEFPADVEKCQYGDNDCITKQITYVSKNYQNGDESLHLNDINPIKFEKIQLKQLKDTPVNIDLVVFNGSAYGMNLNNYIKSSGFGKDIKGPHTIQFFAPKLTVIGDYRINGKILILPIRGVGKANLTSIGMSITVRFEGKPIEKNDKVFLDIAKMKTRVELKRWHLNFTNLFNDKALSDNMNNFLNENWSDIWDDLKDSISKELNNLFLHNILKPFFNNNPYSDLFLDE